MEKFEIIKILGEGTYGCVYRALNKVTGETVAIKKLKTKVDSREECLNFREVKSLIKMNNHPHIVKLIELIKEFDYLYFVFENMEINLFQLIQSFKGKVFPPDEFEVRGWCFQIFKALDYVHKSGYMHRDLKPENFLVSGVRDGNINIKMADFGMATEILSGPPHTEGVGSLWYRAPEVLLGSSYDSSMDMWSMGAIMAELFNLQPLFPGSSEVEQMYKICSVIGSPNRDSWAEGMSVADSINYRFPHHSGIDLSVLIPTASKNAINLISSLCSWDPRKRPTAAEALHHPFFNGCYQIPRPFPLITGNSGLGNFSTGNITTDAVLLNAWVKNKIQMEYNLQLPSYQPLPNLNLPCYQPLPNLNLPCYQPLPDLNLPSCQALPDLNLPTSTFVHNEEVLLGVVSDASGTKNAAGWQCPGLGYTDYKHLPPSHQKSEAEHMYARGGCQWVGCTDCTLLCLQPPHHKAEASTMNAGGGCQWAGCANNTLLRLQPPHHKAEASTMNAGGGLQWLGHG